MHIQRNAHLQFENWGLIPYQEAFERQLYYFQKIVDIKLRNRNLPQESQIPTPNYIFSCEHPHVYTLGRSGKENHLLLNEGQLKAQQIEYVETTRGGDITYHGPGQLVVYPILDLENFFTDIHKYMRLLEEAVILTLNSFDVHAERIQGLTGVWLKENRAIPTKICAMGVKTSRWVTMHGIGLNVNTDLNFFDYIVPCGISDKGITSIEKEIGKSVNMLEVIEIFLGHFSELFDCKLINLLSTVKSPTE